MIRQLAWSHFFLFRTPQQTLKEGCRDSYWCFHGSSQTAYQ
jgi:hypothetical protein